MVGGLHRLCSSLVTACASDKRDFRTIAFCWQSVATCLSSRTVIYRLACIARSRFEATMDLRWRQTRYSWIAIAPDANDVRGQQLERPVEQYAKALCSHLLSLGGKIVALEFVESPNFCKTLVELGQETSCKNLEIYQGESRQCHITSAVLWSKNRKTYNLFTGFGLSEDGVWRRHSWIVTNKGVLIETTVPREKYFGLSLNAVLAELFLQIYLGSNNNG